MRNHLTNDKFKNKLFIKTYNDNRTEKWCNKCERYLTITNFDKQANGLKSQCKNCIKYRQKRNRRNNKQTMVDYLGGQCANCGYNDCIAALDFHHTNPKTKTMELNRKIECLLTKEIYNELDKCTLLCANCHRTIHYHS